MNCKVSGQYGKDNDKVLHFYCENCGKEMEYNEKRICFAENGTQSPTPNYNDILEDFKAEMPRFTWYDKLSGSRFLDEDVLIISFQQALTLATERAVSVERERIKEWANTAMRMHDAEDDDYFDRGCKSILISLLSQLTKDI